MTRHVERTPRSALLTALRAEDGFTLVEMLVSLIFIAVLFTAFAGLASVTMTRSAQIDTTSSLQTQVRAAAEGILDEIRDAYPPTPSSTSAFVSSGTMSGTSLTFYAPDQTSTTAAPSSFYLREISYQLSGGNLQRQAAFSTTTGTTSTTSWAFNAFGPWITLLSGVTNASIFTYYTNAVPAVTTTDPTKVATVVVTLTVNNPQTGGTALTYTDSATMRTAP